MNATDKDRFLKGAVQNTKLKTEKSKADAKRKKKKWSNEMHEEVKKAIS